MKKLLAFLIVCLFPARAWAQLGTVPYTFTPGTTILSAEVNANFSTVYSNALNRTGGTMTGTLTSQDVIPVTSNTYDLGSSSFLFRTGYLRTSLVLGQSSGNYTISWNNPAASRALTIPDPGGADSFVFLAATQTLTNKTLTAPVLSGTVTGTYTIGGTPTISSPIFSGTVTGTYTMGGSSNIMLTGAVNANTAFGNHTWNAGSTGFQTISAKNTSAGTGNGARLAVMNDASDTLNLDIYSSTFTTSTYQVQSGTAIVTGASGGMSLGGIGGSSALRLFAGGTSIRFGINTSGDWLKGSNIMDSVGTPTLNSVSGGACPCTATIGGTDYAITVSAATGLATSVTINFGHTWTTAPVCVVAKTGSTGGGGIVAVTTTTTTVTLARSGTDVLGDGEMVLCRSY